MKCIFCKKEILRNQFSTEHVFPESIGGSFKINSVCKDCNSKLGEEVDSKLGNHLFVKMIRYELGLAGKKGIMPLPFKHGRLKGSPANDAAEIRISLKHDNISHSIHGSVINKPFEPKAMNDGIEWYECCVDSKNMDDLVPMIQKFFRKKGITEPLPKKMSGFLEYVRNVPDGDTCQIKIAEDILFRCKLAKADPNMVECLGEVDTVDYKRAIVKIAYELACEWLGTRYLDDPCGAKLRRFILDPLFVSPPIENAVNGIINFVAIPFQENPLVTDTSNHMARICYYGNCLVCQVGIFNAISGVIIVTENQSAYPLFIATRIELDPKEGTFRKTLMEGVTARLELGGSPRFEDIHVPRPIPAKENSY